MHSPLDTFINLSYKIITFQSAAGGRYMGCAAKTNGRYQGKSGEALCPDCNAVVKANNGPNGPKYAEHTKDGKRVASRVNTSRTVLSSW